MGKRRRSPKVALRWKQDRIDSGEANLVPPPPDEADDFPSVHKMLSRAWWLYTGYLSYCQTAIRHELTDCRPVLKKARTLAIDCAERWRAAQSLPSPQIGAGRFVYQDGTEEQLTRTLPNRIDYVDFNFPLSGLVGLLVKKEVPESNP